MHSALRNVVVSRIVVLRALNTAPKSRIAVR